MSIPLVVSNATYNFPANRDSPGWGEDVTAWAQAVTTAISTVTGNGDIAQTSAIINNNQVAATNVVGLAFDTSVVRGAVIDYSVYRVTTTVEVVETGTMYLSYKSTAAVWEMAVIGSSGSNVTFSVTNLGQIQYTSDSMAGASYSGIIRFRARALLS